MAGPVSCSNDIQTRASNKCNSTDPYRIREPITYLSGEFIIS